MSKKFGLSHLQWGIVLVWWLLTALNSQQPPGSAAWVGGLFGSFLGSFLLVYIGGYVIGGLRGKLRSQPSDSD